MNNRITTYYIPNNPNILTGQIYTLYVNNNTNLDLTNIIEEKELVKPKILINNDEYNKLINICRQIQTTINKRNNNIENYIKEEKENINNLNKLNIDYNNILKNLTSGDGKSE